MSRAVADTSVFIAQETGRELGELPDLRHNAAVITQDGDFSAFDDLTVIRV